MSRGILLCAHDNGLFWYGRMAYCCALMIKHHMGDHDIRLVTDDDTWEKLISAHPNVQDLITPIIIDSPNPDENKRIYKIDGRPVRGDYFNTTRRSVFELSPFEETLVIDVDMLIQNDRLNLVWGSENEFMMNKRLNPLVFPDTYGTYEKKMDGDSIPIYWATILYFRKSEMTKKFFRVVDYVVVNYDYFGLVYGYPSGTYRNDYTFSVAAHIANGHLPESNHSFVQPLPIPYLTFAWDRDYPVEINKDDALFRVDGKVPSLVRTRTNVHCMNKSKYETFSDRIIDLYA